MNVKQTKARIAADQADNPHHYRRRIRVEGLCPVYGEDGVYELILDHEPAQLPDMGGTITALQGAGFDQPVIDAAIDSMAQELWQGQWARYLAARIRPE